MINREKRVQKLSKANVKSTADRRIGNQAAFEQQASYKLCDDLAGKFARRSCGGRNNYGLIATAFLRVRRMGNGTKKSLVELLLDMYQDDSSLHEFLIEWDKRIRDYTFACIEGQQFPLQIRGCVIGDDLLGLLAHEYVRDRKTLMAFLSAAFKRWRGIFDPRSLWRVRFVTQQIAAEYKYDRKCILAYLQKIGAVPNNLTARQTYAWRSRIGQYLSRDQRTAARRDFGFGRRPKPHSFGALLKPRSSKKSR